MAVSRSHVASFLYFGYGIPPADSLKQERHLFDWATLSPSQEGDIRSESELVDEGKRALCTAYEAPSGDLHVVPLSGGLDSRAVLGGLLAAGLREKTVGVTFGTPGTLDYELPARVAQTARIRFERIDLTARALDEDWLVQAARNGAAWTFLLDAGYNRLIPRRFGERAVYWSGFMGGELAGAHVPGIPSPTWGEAVARFARHERFRGSEILMPVDFRATDFLPPSPILGKEGMTFDDQLDFLIRQHHYIQKVVLVPDHDYRTPFLHPAWVRFIMGVPHRYRVGKYLFNRIVESAYPELFNLPTSNTYGLPLRSPRLVQRSRRVLGGVQSRLDLRLPGLSSAAPLRQIWNSLGILRRVKYIDFDRETRNGGVAQKVVGRLVHDLAERGVVDWVDIHELWASHQDRQRHCGASLFLLAALELSLASDEMAQG